MSPRDDLRPLIDDPQGILDSDSVLRVVQPGDVTGEVIQSSAFQDYSADVAAEYGLGGPCASVNLRSIWEARSADIEVLLADFHPGSGIAEIPVSAMRGLTDTTGVAVPHGVMLDPRPDRPWHAVMFSTDGRRRTKGMKRALVGGATWFHTPSV